MGVGSTPGLEESRLMDFNPLVVLVSANMEVLVVRFLGWEIGDFSSGGVKRQWVVVAWINPSFEASIRVDVAFFDGNTETKRFQI